MAVKVECSPAQVWPFLDRLAGGADLAGDPCFLAIERVSELSGAVLRVKLQDLFGTFLRFLHVEYHTKESGDKLWQALGPIEESLALKSKLLLIYRPIVERYREPEHEPELRELIDRFRKLHQTPSPRSRPRGRQARVPQKQAELAA
jgi:hypothetical protein